MFWVNYLIVNFQPDESIQHVQKLFLYVWRLKSQGIGLFYASKMWFYRIRVGNARRKFLANKKCLATFTSLRFWHHITCGYMRWIHTVDKNAIIFDQCMATSAPIELKIVTSFSCTKFRIGSNAMAHVLLWNSAQKIDPRRRVDCYDWHTLSSALTITIVITAMWNNVYEWNF